MSQIYSGNYCQSQECQQFNFCQDSYPLFTQSQSQSQNSQPLNFLAPCNQPPKSTNLPIINEEESSNSQAVYSQKQQIISQQIDQLLTQSQGIELDREEQFHLEVVNQVTLETSEKMMSNFKQKQINQTRLLQKPSSLKKISVTNHDNAPIMKEFKIKIDEFRNKLIGIVEEAKNKFADIAERYLAKLLENVNQIEIILVAETDATLQEEQRNKVIDQKIEILFKEIFSLLSDLEPRAAY